MTKAPEDCDTGDACATSIGKGFWNGRVSFKISNLISAAALAGVWLALTPVTSLASRFVLAAIMLTWLFGCWRTRRAVYVMLPAIYVPHLWIFLIRDYPWNENRQLWAAMFWQLPGLVPSELLRLFGVHALPGRIAGMAIAAVALWLAAVTLGRPGKRWLWITAAAAFGLSVSCAFFEQGLFRM